MSKIARKLAKIFGETAGAQQIGQFGSFAAGSVAYSTDPDVIQSLGNYSAGWFAAIVGSNSPAIQDVNALDYLWSYQLAYLMQAGIPEWDDDTTYYIGSIVAQVATGILYRSIQDANINNAVTDPTFWESVVPAAASVPTQQIFLTGSGTYTKPASCRYIEIEMVAGGGGGGGNGGGGSTGGNTTFGTSFLSCVGGAGGGAPSGGGGSGGAASVTGGGFSGVALSGGSGNGAGAVNNTPGGMGAASPFGGQGGGGTNSQQGQNAIDNTGSGGGGAGGTASAPPPGGAGAGGYIKGRIAVPNSTYAYSVGAGGTQGGAGGGNGGGLGGKGIIIVNEFY